MKIDMLLHLHSVRQTISNLLPLVLGLGEDVVTIATSFMTLNELERRCQAEPTKYLVEGLLPADDVHVAVGDSGLGKTAWAYQLGLCVAAGVPFLGMEVHQGRVLYLDLENGHEDIVKVSRTLCSHLGIEAFPAAFLCGQEANEKSLADALAQHHPALAIIDTLRPFRPEAEKHNDEMGRFLQQLKSLARRYHCAILLLHHVRKSGENGVPSLEETPTLEWLEQAAGARALINQTNTRIAFDRARRGQVDAAFVMKSFVKMKGEGGPIFIDRVCDPEGEPIGYNRMLGVQLLGNPVQEAALACLPKQFTFREAKQVYGRSDDPTRKWLVKCEAAGLVKHTARGLYVRDQSGR